MIYNVHLRGIRLQAGLCRQFIEMVIITIYIIAKKAIVSILSVNIQMKVLEVLWRLFPLKLKKMSGWTRLKVGE